MAEYVERESLEMKLNRRYENLVAENGQYDYYTDGYEEAVSTVEDFFDGEYDMVDKCPTVYAVPIEALEQLRD